MAHPLMPTFPQAMVQPGRRLVTPPTPRVALVGYARSRVQAPFDDPSWQVWTMNEGAGAPLWTESPRTTLHVELHRRSVIEQEPGYLDWLRASDVPVVMLEAYEDIPMAVRFPLADAISLGGDYFTCTMAYLVALALLEGASTIGIWGVHAIEGSEQYQTQKPCLEYWLGLARGHGVGLEFPDDCALLRHTHRYGYESEPDPAELAARRQADLARIHAEYTGDSIARMGAR